MSRIGCLHPCVSANSIDMEVSPRDRKVGHIGSSPPLENGAAGASEKIPSGISHRHLSPSAHERLAIIIHNKGADGLPGAAALPIPPSSRTTAPRPPCAARPRAPLYVGTVPRRIRLFAQSCLPRGAACLSAFIAPLTILQNHMVLRKFRPTLAMVYQSTRGRGNSAF